MVNQSPEDGNSFLDVVLFVFTLSLQYSFYCSTAIKGMIRKEKGTQLRGLYDAIDLFARPSIGVAPIAVQVPHPIHLVFRELNLAVIRFTELFLNLGNDRNIRACLEQEETYERTEFDSNDNYL